MKVDLPDGFSISFRVCQEFIADNSFLGDSIDWKYFHVRLYEDVLKIKLDPISHQEGILDGPNGVFKWLSIKDGSLAGSIPHDVIWEFAKELSRNLNFPIKLIRKFGDHIYCWTTFAYGGKTWWTRLANRFCHKVAFPFGNFLKEHDLPLPKWTAPIIVILLAPIAFGMFLFGRKLHNADLVSAGPVRVVVDGKELVLESK